MISQSTTATHLISKVLVLGSQVLPCLIQDLLESRKATSPMLWKLLCLAYAARCEALLKPLSRLLLYVSDQAEAGIPDDFREAASGGQGLEALTQALQLYGLRQRARDPLASGEPEILRLLVAKAEEGQLLFTLRCPGCGQTMTVNLLSDFVHEGHLTCITCFLGLTLRPAVLARQARQDVLKFLARLKGIETVDQRVCLQLIAAARLLRGILDIYFLRLRNERIGHLLLNTAVFLSRLQRDGKLETSLVFAFPSHPDLTSNPYALEFWTQILFLEPWVSQVYATCLSMPGFAYLCVDLDHASSDLCHDDEGLLCQHRLPLGFTEAEKEQGCQATAAMGIPAEASYVCFLGRDEVYLNRHLVSDQPRFWDYHNYRNVSIEHYIPAMRWLSEKSIWSLRMGHLVKKQLDAGDPRIIDYASNHRSPFLDIYLGGTCAFYVSCMTGPDIVPLLLDRPLLLVNVPQYASRHFFADSRVLVAFKKIYCHKEERFLSFEEAVERGLGGISNTEELVKAQVSLIENSPEEILEAVQEMKARLDGLWVETKEEQRLQHLFQEAINRHVPQLRTVRAKVSMAFLNRNPYFFP